MQGSDPDVAVVMITAYGSISTAIEAMKNGAYDYLLKPFDPNELGVLIEKITEHQATGPGKPLSQGAAQGEHPL